jgi:hypothetical protein
VDDLTLRIGENDDEHLVDVDFHEGWIGRIYLWLMRAKLSK